MTDGARPGDDAVRFEPFAYIAFAKKSGRVRFPLTASGVPDADTSAFACANASCGYAAGAAALETVAARLAARYGVPRAHVRPALGTSGACHLVLTALDSLLPPGAAVAVERPGYGVFAALARNLGRRVVHVDRRADDWSLDVDAFERAFAQGARVACVTDLANPTGTALTADTIRDLDAAAARHGAWIVSDEVYRDFLPGAVGTHHRPGNRVIAVSSLTKCYGLGGLRAGFVFAPREVLRRIEEIEELTVALPVTPWLALFGEALLHADSLLARGRAAAAAGRPVMDAWIASAPGVSWIPPAAGISGLVRVDGVRSSARLAARLREELDVEVVAGAWFGAEGHVRVSFGRAPSDVAAALDVLDMGLRALRDD